MSNHSNSQSSNKLVEDVKMLIQDVQDLLKATTSGLSDRATDARSRVQDSLKVAQDKLLDVHQNVKAKGQVAITATDTYVRDNPWNAVGIAAGIGFILGIGFSAGAFLRRRDD
jgi:ElaB/YqjD/DUF883 family membrane-anchored ribosome-binding protein